MVEKMKHTEESKMEEEKPIMWQSPYGKDLEDEKSYYSYELDTLSQLINSLWRSTVDLYRFSNDVNGEYDEKEMKRGEEIKESLYRVLDLVVEQDKRFDELKRKRDKKI